MKTITSHESHQTFEYIKQINDKLAANLFRATQVEEKFKRDNIKGKA